MFELFLYNEFKKYQINLIVDFTLSTIILFIICSISCLAYNLCIAITK